MANLYAHAKTTSKARGNNTLVGLTSTPDGALYTADWLTSLALEGRLFTASHGLASTPINFNAVADYAATKPMFTIDVPAGTTIIPVSIQVYFETAVGTLTECWAVAGTGNVGAGTSTAVAAGLTTRLGSGLVSACTLYGTHTAAGTAPGAPREFWRDGHPVAVVAGVPTKFEYDVRKYAPVLIGNGATGCLAVYAEATTSATGYVKVAWVELSSSDL